VVQLDDRTTRAAVDKAREVLKRAELTLARERALLDQRNTSEKQVELAQEEEASARADLAAAEAQMAVVDLASPLAGVVTRIQVQPGQAVDASAVVAEIVDLRRLVVSVAVPASEAALLKAARPVEIRLDDHTGEPAAKGEVTFVSPSVDPKTGTTLVRVALPADSTLWPGQWVHARILREEHADRLAVPSASVYTDHDGRSTLSVIEGDTAIRREVTVGLREGDLVEVSGAGLNAGARVVTVGSYGLPEKTKVRVLDAAPHTSEGATSR
jgi:membrane fusion protein (multidrug efflux system)